MNLLINFLINLYSEVSECKTIVKRQLTDVLTRSLEIMITIVNLEENQSLKLALRHP